MTRPERAESEVKRIEASFALAKLTFRIRESGKTRASLSIRLRSSKAALLPCLKAEL
jgi:hypothetical protein